MERLSAEVEQPSSTQEAAKQRMPRKVHFAIITTVCLVLVGIGIAFAWFSEDNLLQTTSDSMTGSSYNRAEGEVSEEQDELASKEDALNEDTQDAQEEATGQEQTSNTQATGDGTVNSGEANQSPSSGETTSTNPSNSSSSSSSASPPAKATIEVYLSVDSSRATQFGYPAQMTAQTLSLVEGASVYDALCATGLSVGGSSSYVTSINGLGEKQLSAGAGWLYFVNGVSPSPSCGSYKLFGGETITWVYTLDNGNDL